MDPQSGNNDDLRSKFEDFEYAPHEEVWSRVQHDTASSAKPGALGPLFAGFGHAPQARVWGRIVAGVYPGRRRRAIIWWSAAAGILLLALVGLTLRNSSATIGAERADQGNPASNDATNQVQPDQNPDLTAEYAPGTSPATNSPDKPASGKQPATANSGIANVDPSPGSTITPGPKGPKWKVPVQQKSNSPLPRKQLVPKSAQQQLTLAKLDLPAEYILHADSLPAPQTRQKSIALAQQEKPAPLQNLWEEVPIESAEPESQYAATLASNFSPAITGFAQNDAEALYDGSGGNGVLGLGAADPGRGNPEEYGTPVMIGARLEKRLSKRFNLSAGPLFTRLPSRPATQFTANGDFRTNRDYLGLALEGKFTFVKSKRVAAYSSAGFRYDVGVQKNDKFIANDNVSHLQSTRVKTSLGDQAAVTIGAGLDYALTKHFGLYAQGDLNHYFYQSEYNLWSTKRIWPSLQVGLRIKL